MSTSLLPASSLWGSRLLCGLAASALLSAAGAAHAVSILDSFSDGSGFIQTDSAPFVENRFASTEAPGGGRYLANTIDASIAQPGKFTFAGIQSGAYFTLADPALPIYTNLTWGVANGFGADLSWDLRSESAFALDFRYVTTPTSLTLTVSTSVGPGLNPLVSGFALGLAPSFGERVVIPFSALVAATSVGVNWADIDSITLIASGGPGGGFALDAFSTTPVPEPGVTGMLLCGLGVMALTRCRAQRAAVI